MLLINPQRLLEADLREHAGTVAELYERTVAQKI
jgi:hypothetical protein